MEQQYWTHTWGMQPVLLRGSTGLERQDAEEACCRRDGRNNGWQLSIRLLRATSQPSQESWHPSHASRKLPDASRQNPQKNPPNHLQLQVLTPSPDTESATPVDSRCQAARLNSIRASFFLRTLLTGTNWNWSWRQCGHCRLCHCILISSRLSATTADGTASHTLAARSFYFYFEYGLHNNRLFLLKSKFYFALHSPCSVVKMTSGGPGSVRNQIQILILCSTSSTADGFCQHDTQSLTCTEAGSMLTFILLSIIKEYDAFTLY